MHLHETRTYQTRDFYFAATLCALGMELIDLDRTEPQRASFIFRDDHRRREWTRQYFAGQLRLDPVVLFNSSRGLKRAVYEAEGQPLPIRRGSPTPRALAAG
jgi:hypothetical protein